MNIIHNRTFSHELKGILKYIADDKPSVSLKFKDGLKLKIREIPANPFKYKQSLYFDDKNIRDMTYKTYTVVYELNFEKDSVEILKIFNRNKPKN
ncbi:type II toxin-antitoxin system RelE/ParE family toxin [bacterium]|nr:type II toxin-antitoxin system RelE/ParE family toxin [bacterium]MBU1994143.1 type II toxin-antitoxin system RelE/ParE family toxin [bacterium]